MTDSGAPRAATAFVSYAQSDPRWSRVDTERWRATVHRFAVLLCEMGVDTDLDQFHTHEASVNWDRFGPSAIRERDFTLLAVSHAYRERWEGVNDPTAGAGAVREADYLMGVFNRNQDDFRARLKIVVLPGATTDDIPTDLLGVSRFELDELSETALMDLYRMLTNQPATPKPPTGELKRLSSLPLQSPGEVEAAEAAEEASSEGVTARELADLRIEIARLENTLAGISDVDMIQARRGNFSLPWVRTAYELDRRHQLLLARYAELQTEMSPPQQVEANEVDQDDLCRLLGEIFAAAGWFPLDDVTFEIAQRLMAPGANPETLQRLFQDLPGRTPDVGVVKHILYDLMQHGILQRNPRGRGWVVGQLPSPKPGAWVEPAS